ncbi:hypothetical protein [Micromonospora carbonacea]|uniref:hypothetical protein n=1 Tax=Micromonospora carbonacea TaxID=47853 RepID=UPI003719D161
MTDPLGPVQITGRDIYDALIRLTASVDRLTSQGDGHGEDIRDHEARLRLVEDVRPAPRITDLEGRLRQVEARLWPLPAASLLVALAALAIGLLPKLTT